MTDNLFETLGKICRPPMRRDLIDGIEFEGVDRKDHPDYCDAFISSACYNGRDMTEDELDEINDDSDFKYEKLLGFIH